MNSDDTIDSREYQSSASLLGHCAISLLRSLALIAGIIFGIPNAYHGFTLVLRVLRMGCLKAGLPVASFAFTNRVIFHLAVAFVCLLIQLTLLVVIGRLAMRTLNTLFIAASGVLMGCVIVSTVIVAFFVLVLTLKVFYHYEFPGL